MGGGGGGGVVWGEENEKRKKKKKKRKRKKGEVRGSTFSLESMEIGPLVFVEAKRKVRLSKDIFAWVRKSEVFVKLREVGVFLQLGLVLV